MVAYRQSIFNMHVVLTVGPETTRANHLDLSVRQGSRRKHCRVSSVFSQLGTEHSSVVLLSTIRWDLLEAKLDTISPGLLRSNTDQL